MIYLSYNFTDSFFLPCEVSCLLVLLLVYMPADRKLDARHVRLIVSITQCLGVTRLQTAPAPGYSPPPGIVTYLVRGQECRDIDSIPTTRSSCHGGNFEV